MKTTIGLNFLDIKFAIYRRFKPFLLQVWYIIITINWSRGIVQSIDVDGTIKEIGQKPNSINDIEGHHMGLMKFTNRGISNLRSMFHKCKKNKFVMGNNSENAYMTDLLMQIIYDGIKVQSIPTNRAWVEVDTPNDLESDYTLKRISEI